MDFPLKGIKILDFTYLLPGPYGTMMLADLGADIIKVENYTNPDLMRLASCTVDDISTAHAHINRGKKSLAIDLKKKGASGIIYRLLDEYDILVEQFRPGVMDKLGLGYETLKQINPALIYCSLTGYGQSGPYSQRAGHDINYISLTGIESYSGRKSTGPALSGIQIADICAGGKNLVIAVLAACLRRRRTGEGDYADISITDSTFALSAFQAAGFLTDGKEPEREADLLNGGTIYDFYRTADSRHVSVGPLEPKFAAEFYRAMGLEEMASPLFLSEEEQRNVKQKVAEKFASKPLEHWRAVFGPLDACVEPVYTMAEAVSNPPLAARNMVVEVKNEKGTPLKQVANPMKFASGDYIAPFAGVSLGHHNAEILRAAGYSDHEIEGFKKDGIIN